MKYKSILVDILEDALDSQSNPIKGFYVYMNGVWTVLVIVENKPNPKEKRIGVQASGKRVQDYIQSKMITHDRLVFTN